MNRIAIFFDAGIDESEELAARIADLMHEHTRHTVDCGKSGKLSLRLRVLRN